MHLSISSQTAEKVVVLLLCLPVINVHAIFYNGSLKELAEKDENSVKERKVIMPEVKFSSHVNGVVEEKANRGNVNVASVQQTLAVRPEVSLWTS